VRNSKAAASDGCTTATERERCPTAWRGHGDQWGTCLNILKGMGLQGTGLRLWRVWGREALVYISACLGNVMPEVILHSVSIYLH
jgi:hypothetical protein